MVYFVSLIVLLYYAFTTTGGPLHWFGSGAWGLVPLFLLFGLGPLILWGPIYRRTAARDLSLRQAALLGLVNWPYSYIHHVSTWWAFGRMLGPVTTGRRPNGWISPGRRPSPDPAASLPRNDPGRLVLVRHGPGGRRRLPASLPRRRCGLARRFHWPHPLLRTPSDGAPGWSLLRQVPESRAGG